MEPKGEMAFETTRWSLIDALKSDDKASSRQAGDQLFRLYWPAVYSYLRGAGMDSEQAGEVTQAFFADVVLSRNLFGVASRNKGKLRALLLTALRRYRVDLARRARAHPDWDRPAPSLVREVEARMMPDSSPESAFDREWALAILDEARRRCQDYFCSNGKSEHWEVFEARHITPIASGSAPPPLDRLAAMHNFRSAASVAAAIQVVRKRFKVSLVAVVAEQSSGEAEQEAKYVLEILGAGGR